MAMFPDLPNLYSAFTIISGYKQWRSQNRVVGRAQVGHIYGAVRNVRNKVSVRKTKLQANARAQAKVARARARVCRGLATPVDIRPGKLDLLFRISHLLDLHAGADAKR